MELLKSSAVKFGCFQIVNHEINCELIEAVEMAAQVVFGVSMERKREMEMRRERMWGFEIDEEEGDGEEIFWWGGVKEELEESVFHGCKELRYDIVFSL